MRCLFCQKDGIANDAVSCPRCGVVFASVHGHVLTEDTLIGGRYRIEHALGQGGFGITYRAQHVALGRDVAIKEFYPRDHVTRNTTSGQVVVSPAQRTRYGQSLERFKREGRILATLRHPNVVGVSDLFPERDTAYLVMDYLDGRTLESEMEDAGGKLSEERVREVMEALVGALAAVHAKEIHHLDIKPENVMIAADGRVVLIDFGASRQGLSTRSTQAFTPAYAPVEVAGGGEIGPESDIYELSMMAHQMLTGTLPPDYLQRTMQGLNDWTPDLPEPWKGLIRAGLQFNRADRPHDVRSWWALSECRPIRGADDSVEIQVTAEEARNGCHKAYFTVGGNQGVFTVPPNTVHEAVITVPGQGLEGECGGEHGDLLVKVLVTAPPEIQAAPIESVQLSEPVLPDVSALSAKPARPAQQVVQLSEAVAAPTVAAPELTTPDAEPVPVPRLPKHDAPTTNIAGSKKPPMPVFVAAGVVVLLVGSFVAMRPKGGSTKAPVHAASKSSPAVSGVPKALAQPRQPNPQADVQLLAAASKSTKAAQAALNAGANPNAQDKKTGETPLLKAATAGNVEMAQLLLARGANPNLADRDGLTPLILSCQENAAPFALLILEKSKTPVHVNATNAYRQTALMWAAHHGNEKLVRALLSRGAKTDLKNVSGTNAFDLATLEGHKKIAQLIKSWKNQ